jgi:hypothetical protein
MADSALRSTLIGGCDGAGGVDVCDGAGGGTGGCGGLGMPAPVFGAAVSALGTAGFVRVPSALAVPAAGGASAGTDGTGTGPVSS